MKMYLYFMKLKMAQMKGQDPKKVKKPLALGSVPLVESQVGRRPGERRLFDRLKQYDLISFDIFDTAVLRKVEEPRDVFKIMSCEIGFENFKSMRIEAEREAKMRSYSRHDSDEATLDEIYDVLRERNNVDKDRWMRREIELETRLCMPNLYIKKVYDKLIKAGKKVIFSSDMYLPRQAIEDILKNCGYDSYDALYISSELRLSKKDATMYRHIRERYGEECKVIHVGDNHKTDVKNSKAQGFDNVFYRSVRELAKPYLQTHYNDLSGSFYRAVINNTLHDGTWRRSVHYEHGYKIGGILLAGYCEYINRIVAERNIDLVLFCARDCDVIFKTYKKLYNTSVKSKYLCVSRYALMNIAPERYIIDLVDRTFGGVQDGNVSINNFLASVGLDYLDPFLKENGIFGHDRVNKNNIYKIKKMIVENLSEVLHHNADQIASAKIYLEKMLHKHKNVLIVDVGWSGSSVTILKYFIENNIPSKYEIHGSLLFGSNNETLSSSISAGLIDVYMASSVKNLDLSRTQFSKDREVTQKNNQALEYLFSSVDTSLIRYGFDADGAVDFIKSPHECRNPQEIRDIQNGMMDFVDRYKKYMRSAGSVFCISPYTAYAPFSKMLESDDYVNMIYQNFTYDAAVSQGKEGDATTFGKKYPSKSQKKNKILLITHTFSHTGAPHSLLRICKVLLESGYYCEVWSPESGGMESDFKSEGVPVRIIKPDMLYRRQVVEEIKTFDLAIANTIVTYEYYSRIKKYIPAIWYIREGTNIPEFCSKSLNYSMYLALKRAEDLYCVSDYAAEFIKKYNKNVKIIHNSVEDYSVYSKPSQHDKVRFIQLGSIEYRKGYDVLVDAFASLDPHYKDMCELYFAGRIPNARYYASIMDKVSKTDNIHNLGEIKDDIEKARIMSSMDVVIVASLDEACSLVALEGAMLSKPLIVTENVGAKYMVTSDNGIVAKTNDVDSLKNAIISMIDDRAELPAMGAASRKMYECSASMESHRSDIESMVQSHIQGENKNKWKFVKYRIFKENLLIDTFHNIVSIGSMLINQGLTDSLAYLSDRNILSRKIIPPLEKRYKKFSDKKTYKKVRLSEGHDLIVSLTSFPPRIPALHICINSILKQYLRPNKVILYLANEQFPNKEKDLPDSLLDLCKKGLTIEWCDDLKSHKKYYYAMLKNPKSIIVTVDDDVLYDPATLSKLYLSYLKNPKSISCLRAHRITFDEMGNIKRYRDWGWEDNSLYNKKHYQAIPTGCSGILYPPGSLNEEVFNKENLMTLCPKADDLWLKIMSLANGTTVVLADRNPKLKFVDGTQESSLFHQNVVTGNDVAIRKILDRYNNIRPDKPLTDILRDNVI